MPDISSEVAADLSSALSDLCEDQQTIADSFAASFGPAVGAALLRLLAASHDIATSRSTAGLKPVSTVSRSLSR